MPPMIACGRTWEFGSDDLVFPAAVSVFLRVVWLLGVLIGVVLFRDALTCQHTHLLGAFSFAVIGLLLLTIVLEVTITYFSARGTIVRIRPRKPIVHFLHFRVMVLVSEIVLLIVGTVFAYLPANATDYEACPDLDSAVLATKVIVGVSWALIFLIIAFFLIYLDPCHCYSAKVNYSTVERHVRNGLVDSTIVQDHWQLTHSVWEKRFRVACCMAGSDDTHQHAYREVAEIFSHLFCDVNVVMSDIAAGMILLQKEHLAKEEDSRTSCTTSSLRPHYTSVDFNVREDRAVFRRALHYVKFAMAPYSWPLYAYMNPVTGCCSLLCSLQCAPCYHHRNRENIVGDNSCFCYLAGSRKLSGLNEMDIMHASFENDLYLSPFLVCLDHEMQAVVITIRGTLSMQDMITDLIATTEPIEFPGHPTFLVHKGMLKTALCIKDKLEELEILERCFARVNNKYGLVLTGHSLGSGVACILSMLLRDKFPNLYCYCFSPTGSLVNHVASEYTKSFVTSVTLGEDVVARLNVTTSHLLKEDIIRVLENCRKPKCQILVEGTLETLCKCFGRPVVIRPGQADNSRSHFDDEEENIGNGHSQAINPEDSFEFSPLLRKSLTTLRFPQRQKTTRGAAATAAAGREEEEEEEEEVEHPLALIPLFAPGRVIHIVDASERLVSLCGTRTLRAQWAPNDSFKRVKVSPDMLRDHLVDVVQGAMRSVWKLKMTELEERAISPSALEEEEDEVERNGTPPSLQDT